MTNKRKRVLAVVVHSGEIARKQIIPGEKLKRRPCEGTEDSDRSRKNKAWKRRASVEDVNNTDRDQTGKYPKADGWNKKCLNPD